MTIKEFDKKYGGDGMFVCMAQYGVPERLRDVLIPQLKEKLAKTPAHWKRCQKYLDQYNRDVQLCNDLFSVKGA